MGHARRYYARLHQFMHPCRKHTPSHLAKLKVGEHGLPLMGSGDWNDGLESPGRRRQASSEK
jgi:hypothetical protein